MHEIDNTILQGTAGCRSFTYSLKLFMDGIYKLSGQVLQYSLAHGGPGLPVLHDIVYNMMLGKAPTTVTTVDIEAVGEVDARQRIQKVFLEFFYKSFPVCINVCFTDLPMDTVMLPLT